MAAPIDVQCFYTLCVGANFTLANLVLRAFWGRISGHTANVLYLRHVSHELISYLGHSGHTDDFLYLGQISHEPKSYLEPNSASICLGIRARSRQSSGYHPKLCQFLNWQSFGWYPKLCQFLKSLFFLKIYFHFFAKKNKQKRKIQEIGRV